MCFSSAVFSAVQVKHDGDLILDLTVPEPVEVIYTSSDSAVGEQICNVTQHSLQCKAEYTHRTSLRYPELTLRDVMYSDSGRYTIRNTEYKEDIRVYAVSVTDMRSFNIFVILVLVLKVTFVSGHYTMAKLNQSATLNCTSRCSGLMEWIQPRNKHVTVAWCNQTSCRSEEGYEVSHDRYLKDDLSLTITKADYSKRTWYTCQCGGTDVCHVTLRIEPVEYTRRMNPGEPLYLDLPITENVKVTFNKRGDPGSQSPVPVCTVDGRMVHCDSEYKSRASLKSSLTLNEVKKSDIGVYTVQDTDNDEVIATYHVTGETLFIVNVQVISGCQYA
ncbi:hypothetical protein AMELA_G00243510 [Ameiurus melas]|uniref:Uncharacterized protein n=1 Tax=Ameiurus melas TaxID=219545 RepID=A0A7J5ZWF8_AMEME|nr:hypothetical protein AMELA_G00243510 [Ameiurus melas]